MICIITSLRYRGLHEWKSEKGYLIDTCLAVQDKFKALLNYFGKPHSESKDEQGKNLYYGATYKEHLLEILINVKKLIILRI